MQAIQDKINRLEIRREEQNRKCKEYYKTHRDARLTAVRRWQKNNPENVKKYRENRKDKQRQYLKEYLKRPYKCPCGAEITRNSQYRHNVSQQHINYLKKYMEDIKQITNKEVQKLVILQMERNQGKNKNVDNDVGKNVDIDVNKNIDVNVENDVDKNMDNSVDKNIDVNVENDVDKNMDNSVDKNIDVNVENDVDIDVNKNGTEIINELLPGNPGEL